MKIGHSDWVTRQNEWEKQEQKDSHTATEAEEYASWYSVQVEVLSCEK